MNASTTNRSALYMWNVMYHYLTLLDKGQLQNILCGIGHAGSGLEQDHTTRAWWSAVGEVVEDILKKRGTTNEIP